MVHLRVTLDGLIVNNALQTANPGVPTPSGWKMQANVNGLWQEAGGLAGGGRAAERDAGAIDAVFGAPRYGVSDSRHEILSSTGAYTLVFRIARGDEQGGDD